MTYKIISTGSKGNALLINDNILVDCGVPFSHIKDYYKKLNAVLCTHIHSDHFNKATIKRLAKERPTIRFVCCYWLVQPLLELGMRKRSIDVLEIGKWYDYGKFQVSPVLLYHNVDQCGYRIKIDNKKLFFATDTNKLDGITAVDYDYYFVEANHSEEDINERIEAKQKLGLYCYEYAAKENHLSKEKCDKWLMDNMGANSEYIYLHQHEEKIDE